MKKVARAKKKNLESLWLCSLPDRTPSAIHTCIQIRYGLLRISAHVNVKNDLHGEICSKIHCDETRANRIEKKYI